MRILVFATAIFCVSTGGPHVCRAEDATGHAAGLANPFFAFDNGLGRDHGWTPEQQASVLAELGYDGIGYSGIADMPARLKALDARGLKLQTIFVDVRLAPGKASYDQGLPKAIEQLKGRGTIVGLYLLGGRPSSDALDQEAVKVIHEITDMAEASGLTVSLYPHEGVYLATIQDAVRLIRKVNRKSVGASFSLCHFLKVDDEKNLEARLKEAMPHLFVVSINGSDRGDTNNMGWDRLIKTLDEGDFDIKGLLKLLDRLGYRGPIGLQCYRIPGDIPKNVKRSMETWRKLAGQVKSSR